MMVNEAKAKARVRALREWWKRIGKKRVLRPSSRASLRSPTRSISPSHTDPIYTPFTITQHIRSFILPRGNAPIELPAEEATLSQIICSLTELDINQRF